jgi:HEAT repeat protein
MISRWIRCGAIAALATSLVGIGDADALPKKAKAKVEAPPPFDATGAAALIQSGDPAKIEQGLNLARLAGKPAAPVAPLIEKLLARGTTAALTKAAIDTLGDIGQGSSSTAIAPYARHRDPEIRRAALSALLKTRGQIATDAMRTALGDSDARVRGTAASGLGALGAHDAIPDLTLALDRKVPEAAAAIGQLCVSSECDKFAELTGKVPFDIMTSGFDQILFRTGTDVGDDQKIRLVGRIRELGTNEAHKYLKDVLSRWVGSPTVKTALDQAASATQGSPGGGGAP